jgi:HD-GYP domain-containing protein (c-di-GMP phosphodiesterase class II)
MRRVSFSFEHIRIGEPLPFSVWDENGLMVAGSGYILKDKREYDVMLGKRDKLLVDAIEYERFQNAYQMRLNALLSGDRALGAIASTRLTDMGAVVARERTVSRGSDRLATLKAAPPRTEVLAVPNAAVEASGSAGTKVEAPLGEIPSSEADWLDLQDQAHALLRVSNPQNFRERLEKLQAHLGHYARLNPDGTLLSLFFLSSRDLERYSGTHAMLVSVMCGIAARDVLKWPALQETVLCHAALTMNIGMSIQQDRMAQQREPLNPKQRELVRAHPSHSAALLRQLGVTNRDLLEAVLDHHAKAPGPLAARSQGQRMARLIQRADIFAAAISPRASRSAAATGIAMKAAYFDENQAVDEAGAALVKAVGVYPPGSFVRLASQEVAIVVRRGRVTSAPRVAVVLNREGLPNNELTLRDTSLADWRVTAGLPSASVKVSLNLSRLIPLTRTPASNFPA